MEHANNTTNSTISGGTSGDSSVDAKIVAPLVAAVGLVLVLVGVIAVQVGRAYRNRRSKVYDVSSKANGKRTATQQRPISINTELSIEDMLEDESGQPINTSQSTEQLIQPDNNRCASCIQGGVAVAEVHASESPGGISVLSLQEWDEPNDLVEQLSRSVHQNIPRANPLRLKRKNKIFPMVEESSFASSITDEELIIIGTAIKSCPNLGRESPVPPADYEQDEPCETVSHPALLQTDEQPIMSSSFQLLDASSSSAVDNFYSQSSGEDVPCSKAVQRKDLWSQEDIVSGDVIVIDN